jgi:hypothetical protein
MGCLGTDGGLFTMPGQRPRGVGQDEEPVPDRSDDRREVREASPGGSRAALKEGVTGEEHATGVVKETASPRGVPRRVDDLERRAASGYRHPVGQVPVGRAVGIDLMPQHQVIGVQEDWRIQGVRQGPRGVDVVIVTMGSEANSIGCRNTP